ncbi:MAG TPA: HAD-IA family hydrolase [Acholeplasmataceae bacterium]|nr:HAD-IA family hydrolase [Acholeplasmataceae bacterium]
MIKAVIFDLDGTLVQSEEIIMEGFSYAMAKHLPQVIINKDDETNFLGQTLNRSFIKYTKDIETLKKLIETYKEYTNVRMANGLKTYPNAYKIIKYLKDQNVKVGLVTSKTESVAIENLETTKLDGLFDVIIGYNSVSKHKPDPEGLLKALEVLNVNKENAIYIGDHENDIKAAKSAKMLSCGVTYSKRLNEVLLENPTYVIDDLINIEDII